MYDIASCNVRSRCHWRGERGSVAPKTLAGGVNKLKQAKNGPGDPGLHKQDELFTGLLATAVDGIIVIDPQGFIQNYNQACERLFGYSADEVVGQNVKLLMPAAYDQKDACNLSNHRQSHERRIIGIGHEVVGRRKDGSTFPMDLSVGESNLADRRFFVGIIRDLTKIKREAAQREGADRLLAQIVHSSEDAMISKTLNGYITSWNAAAERIFGYSAVEAIGKPMSMLFPPDRLVEEDEIVAQLKKGHSVEHYETVRRHKDGREILVSLSVAPIHDGSGAMIGTSKVSRDITDRKRAEAHTLGLQNDLAHVGRLNAMGQMSAAIAHELNQPLTAIANYVKAAQRLLEGGNPAPGKLASARDAMDKAAGQTIRAGVIIRHLRDFVEKRESQRSPENLNDVIREAVAMGMLGHKHSNIKLRLALDPAMPLAAIDKVQIQQVLLNLVRNAVEAMAHTARRELTISSAMDSAGARIMVRDSGPGFAAEIVGRLFQPFVTTKEDGMGIGLKICQSIVEAHGGTIEAAAGDPGAVFVIRLPFSALPPDGE